MDPTQPQPTSLPPPPPFAPPPAPAKDTTAKIIYVLYLLSFFAGVTSLVGVVMAYVYRGDAPAPLQTHYRFQIRTFWIGALYALLSSLLLMLFGVGVLGFAFLAVWIIVRCVKGLRFLDRREAVPDPATWLW
ncbi:MAG TPA: hypothetical protein VM753_16195 [Anaeromyxobacter sp.]|nr:hypothetical protein [Anaeromyxobacter sp.]